MCNCDHFLLFSNAVIIWVQLVILKCVTHLFDIIKDIKSYFLLTTGNTLDCYFRQRRLFHAFWQIKKYREKPIGVIANFYGHADCASFNYAFKQAFSVTPTKARANPEFVKDNRLVYGDFQQTTPPKQTIDDLIEKKIMQMIDWHECEELRSRLPSPRSRNSN